MFTATYSLHRYLQAYNISLPSFSPDGQYVTFLADITGLPQLWQLPVQGGWPRQRTFERERVAYGQYSPTEAKIVYGQDEGGNEKMQIWLLAADGQQRQLTHAADTIHHFGAWSHDGRQIAISHNERNGRDFDIAIINIANGRRREVYRGESLMLPTDWSPDHRYLVLQQNHVPFNHDLYLLDLVSGRARYLTPHNGDARYLHPVFAPDGQALYVISDEGREFLTPARIDLPDGRLRFLFDTAWDVPEMAISRDGQWLVYSSNENGTFRLHSRHLPDGQEQVADDLPAGAIGGLTFSPDNRIVAFQLDGPQNPPDIWLHDVFSGSSRRLTQNSRGGIPPTALHAPSLIHYPTFDDRQIPAFFYHPTSDDTTPPPCIVYVHGGPESQFQNKYEPVLQYFVQRGFAVLATNVRGSTGYGRTYTHLDDVEKRLDSVADLAHAVDWLRQSGAVRPDRIGIMGRSYGGFMVLAAVTRYPELWKAAVDIVGIANMVTFLENTSPWRRHLREAEYGSLARDRDLLEQISPIHMVDRITAPMLVIHSDNDTRVPIGEAEQIVAALRDRKHPVEYLHYANEGHQMVRLENKIDAYRHTADFFARYLA